MHESNLATDPRDGSDGGAADRTIDLGKQRKNNSTGIWFSRGPDEGVTAPLLRHGEGQWSGTPIRVCSRVQ